MRCVECDHAREDHNDLGCCEKGCDCQVPKVFVYECIAQTAEERVGEMHGAVLLDILNERKRQNEKWGEQNHDAYRWLAILSEEVGEAAQAALHNEFGGKAKGTLQTELIHVASVAIQWLECIERHGGQQ